MLGRTIKRFISYTKYNEPYSKPKEVKTKQTFHPVLGLHESEIKLAPEPIPLIKILRNKHRQKVTNNSINTCIGKNANKLSLGDVVYLERNVAVSSVNKDSFVGVVIEKAEGKFIRVRNILMGVGVELKIPLQSPLLTRLDIIKRAKDNESTIGISAAELNKMANLFGVRESEDEMRKFLEERFINDKERMVFIKQMQKS